jgi:predicted ester cyclase
VPSGGVRQGHGELSVHRHHGAIRYPRSIAEGDKVVTRLRARGRHEGELAGIPPTGNEMDVMAIAVHRIADGRIVEHWGVTDSAPMLAQLGVITLPGPPPS